MPRSAIPDPPPGGKKRRTWLPQAAESYLRPAGQLRGAIAEKENGVRRISRSYEKPVNASLRGCETDVPIPQVSYVMEMALAFSSRSRLEGSECRSELRGKGPPCSEGRTLAAGKLARPSASLGVGSVWLQSLVEVVLAPRQVPRRCS